MARACVNRSAESGAMTSASLLIATTIARSFVFSWFRNVCEACLASSSGLPAMLQLRSTPSATVSGNSPEANCDTSWGSIVFVHLEVIPAQAGDELALVVGDGGVDLDKLRLRRKGRERAFLLVTFLRACPEQRREAAATLR